MSWLLDAVNFYFLEETTIKDFLINEQIVAREVRVLDANGDQAGVMSLYAAKEMAAAQSLDVVLISPQAQPPVVRIIDYGKYKFEAVKKEKENRKNQKAVEIKEVQLSPTIDIGDMKIKARNALRFFEEGNKVKVSIRMSGRQQARPEISLKVMEEFLELVKDQCLIEKRPLIEGRNIHMILSVNKPKV